MLPATVLFFGLCVFSLTVILMTALYRSRLQVHNRLAGLQDTESPEAGKAGRADRRRAKAGRSGSLLGTRKFLRRLENELYDIGIHIPVGKFVLLWACVAIGVPLLLLFFGIKGVLPLLAAVLLSAGPILYMSLRRNSRRQKLEGQITEAIVLLCNALRAGHSFQSAMNTIASDMEPPISEEFGRVFRETLRGMSMDESLRRMVDRVGSKDLEILTTAITIQREIGGNLTEILENISGTIQARIDMRAEVKTRTSAGRASGYIIGALPVIILIIMTAISPDYCMPLFQKELGRVMLAVGLLMELIGFTVIKKITTIKY